MKTAKNSGITAGVLLFPCPPDRPRARISAELDTSVADNSPERTAENSETLIVQFFARHTQAIVPGPRPRIRAKQGLRNGSVASPGAISPKAST
jgi:hypothetical protein